jgi:hypothetical protein
MVVEEPRVSDEPLQAEPLDAVSQPAEHGLQSLANPGSAKLPGLLKALTAQKRRDLEGILTACDVRPTASACGCATRIPSSRIGLRLDRMHVKP